MTKTAYEKIKTELRESKVFAINSLHKTAESIDQKINKNKS